MSMKILIIPDNIGSMGGTRTFLITLLKIHHIHHFKTILALQSDQTDQEILDLCNQFSIKLVLLKKRKLLFYKPYFSLLYDFYVYFKTAFIFKPNLIVASIGTPRLFYGLFFFNTPMAYYLHTYPYKLPFKASLMDQISQHFSSRKKKFVTVSTYSKNAIKNNMHTKTQFIDVIYNSVDIPLIDTKYETQPIILTVGHVEAYKNPTVWYEVAKNVINQFSNVMFYWVGEGGLLENMRTKVLEDKLEKNIFFVGQNDKVQKYYQKASIYFHPSLIENHSIAILEAMSYKLPCIASNTGGIPESVINNTSGYLVEPYDILDFTDKICYLLKNKKTAQKMGYSGYEIIQKKFQKKFQIEKILNLYKQLIFQESISK